MLFSKKDKYVWFVTQSRPTKKSRKVNKKILLKLPNYQNSFNFWPTFSPYDYSVVAYPVSVHIHKTAKAYTPNFL